MSNMTMRDQLIETGLFTETSSRELIIECPRVDPMESIRVRFIFNTHGELEDVLAGVVDLEKKLAAASPSTAD